MFNVLGKFQALPFKIELCTRGKDTHIYIVLYFYDTDEFGDFYWKRLCFFSAFHLTDLVDLFVRAINILSNKYKKTDWGYKIKENKNDKD